MDPKTLGVILFLWSRIIVVRDWLSFQSPNRGDKWPVVLYCTASPLGLIATDLMAVAGGVLARRASPAGLLLAGVRLLPNAVVVQVNLVSEATSLSPPLHLPWQWAAGTATSMAVRAGLLYRVWAALVTSAQSTC